MHVRRLVDFPYVLVRLRCEVCKRKGAYRLARLATKYGSEILLDDLIVRLSNDCPWRDDPRGKGCGAQFSDLPPRRPPDMPVAKRCRREGIAELGRRSMCGRYAITTAPEAIRRLFQVSGPTPNFAPHYNAAPGQELPVIRLHPESGDRVLGTLRWGLIPYWSKDAKIGWKCINARGETVKITPAFRDAYKRRRCIVPADAFFEWKANGKAKQPYAIAMRERLPFAFGGLWENWKDPATQDWVRTFTILTTPPNDIVAPLHDRMPLILAPADYDQWLDKECDPADLIRTFPGNEMVTSPISTRVNKPENDDAAILDRLAV